MRISVTGGNWTVRVAVAVSAGSLAVSLAGCGTRAQAVPVTARAAAGRPPGTQVAARGWFWRVVATRRDGGVVDGLSASGKNNAWLSEMSLCVKKCAGPADFRHRQLRWNGTAWRPVALPAAYARGIVVPASPVSNWIVGAVPVSNPLRNVVLHWTGKGPGTVTRLNKNAGIGTGVAPAAKDAWLFGSTAAGSAFGGSYALHYHAGTWRPVKVPFIAGQGASASSPSNIWVSGYRPGDDSAAVMAFNGKKWRKVPLPPLPSSLYYTGSGHIAAASPSNVWLEIDRTSYATSRSTPCLLHWTGSKWTSIKIPYRLDDMGGAPVARDGHGGVWLSLTDIKKKNWAPRMKPLLLHYRHGRWTRFPVPATAGYEVMPGPVALTWIPRTRSLWGTATEENPKSPIGSAKLVIFKYGP